VTALRVQVYCWLGDTLRAFCNNSRGSYELYVLIGAFQQLMPALVGRQSVDCCQLQAPDKKL